MFNVFCFFFFKQKTAYEMRISDWSSDVCSSDLASVAQFALPGLSDSANAVAYYDKGGLQARVAWNWRDEFLNTTGPNPAYTEAYWQIDASASYEFVPGLTGFVEEINLTGESRRVHRRADHTVTSASPGFARYSPWVRLHFSTVCRAA